MAHKSITPRGRTSALIGGGIGGLAVLTVRFVTESPWTVFHRLSAGDILPPLWLLGLLWFAIPILCGLGAGLLWADIPASGEAGASFWRGCTCLVLSLMCMLAWYALLFGKCSLFFSGLCLLAAMLCSCLCVLAWKSFSIGAVLLVGGNTLWCLALFLMQLGVALHA